MTELDLKKALAATDDAIGAIEEINQHIIPLLKKADATLFKRLQEELNLLSDSLDRIEFLLS